MTIVDGIAWLACAASLSSACAESMLLLRAFALCSNLTFLSYGLSAGIVQIVCLHAILAVLNGSRLLRLMSAGRTRVI